MIELTYWFMFPLGTLIATIAMMFGIGGAVFFSPLFFLVLKLKPETAIGAGIIIEVFGFTSGLIGYARKKMINYSLGKRILFFTIPSVIIGVIIGKLIPGIILQAIFAWGIFILAFFTLKKETGKTTKPHIHHKACIGWKSNKSCYTFEHTEEPIYYLSVLGGLSLGMISSGLGEINEYSFIKKLKLHPALASGTSVFIVMITALAGALLNIFYELTSASTQNISIVLSILIFTVPGVILGGQIGARLSNTINETTSKNILFIIFIFIGLISLIKLFL